MTINTYVLSPERPMQVHVVKSRELDLEGRT